MRVEILPGEVPPIKKVPNDTKMPYTLFIRGELTLNWDDLPFLEAALLTVPSTRNTYIQYNDTGVKQYAEDARWVA